MRPIDSDRPTEKFVIQHPRRYGSSNAWNAGLPEIQDISLDKSTKKRDKKHRRSMPSRHVRTRKTCLRRMACTLGNKARKKLLDEHIEIRKPHDNSPGNNFREMELLPVRIVLAATRAILRQKRSAKRFSRRIYCILPRENDETSSSGTSLKKRAQEEHLFREKLDNIRSILARHFSISDTKRRSLRHRKSSTASSKL